LKMMLPEIQSSAKYSTGNGNINVDDMASMIFVPVPKTPELLQHWTDRVGTPYDAKHAAERRIEEVEATVRDMVKTAVDTEGACEMVALGDVCEMQVGNFNANDSCKTGTYPFYKGRCKNPNGYSNVFSFDYPEYLLIVKGGGSGKGKYGDQIALGKTFRVSGKTAVAAHLLCLTCTRSNIFNWVYTSLTLHKNQLMDIANYSTGLGSISQQNLKAFKIPVPKTPELAQQLQPHFDELDRLREEVKQHEAAYEQALVDLRAAALEE
jgi:hypothetical protein